MSVTSHEAIMVKCSRVCISKEEEYRRGGLNVLVEEQECKVYSGNKRIRLGLKYGLLVHYKLKI